MLSIMVNLVNLFMTISVVIPAYNEEAYLGKTLQSVIENVSDNVIEIIVVNNASTDRTREVAQSFGGVTVVDEQKKGLTKARQAGLNAAHGDILAYIDADTLVRKEWFEIINKEFKQNPKLVFLSGPYVYYDTPAWQQWAVKWLYYNLLARVIYSFTRYMASGGNMVAKKSALLQAGGFDTNIEFYGEDTDIARRLSAVGETKFARKFWVATSGRRFKGEGTFKTGSTYVANYTSIMFTKKPLTKKYKDIR